jgi:OFA family oxalate/formate antiporter-like MFS transporter
MNRWFRLAAAAVAMIMIANLQYAWTLFVKQLLGAHADLHWKLSDVQWAFTIFIACQTWFMAPSGWLIDKIGPRQFMTVGGLLCGAGWAMLSQANSLPALYAFYAATGVGAALVYCGSMGVALKWFPDKRGLAAGITAAAFGSGTALFIPIIASLLRTDGYRTTFIYTGVTQGILIMCAAQFLRSPQPGEVPAVALAAKPKIRSRGEDFTPSEMLRTSHFYILYLTMFIMGVGGLMVTAQLSKLAETFKITAAALTLAASMNPIANGASRLFWGWVSDHLGRERSMVIAFLIQSVALLSVPLLAPGSDTFFILCLALVYFSWGEIYVLFPSLAADIFGSRNASANYGFLYSTKGVAAIVGGGLAAMLFERTGSWSVVFYGGAVMAFASALMAAALIKMPLPRKTPAPELAAVNARGLSAEG